MEWIKQFFSINEGKTSALIIGFLITIMVAMYMYVTKFEITNNMRDIIFAFIVAIGGVNIANPIISYMNGKLNNSNGNNENNNIIQ